MSVVHETRLGVLGGMGPQATLTFYQMILDRTEAHRDQEHLPTLLWSDTNMPDRTGAILGGREEAVLGRMREGLHLLEAAGCTVIAVPCNTSHHFLQGLRRDCPVPILDMPLLAAGRLRAEGARRVLILGTDGTLKTGLYQRACEAVDLLTFTPPPTLQRQIMALIYDEIKAGRPGSPTAFLEIDACVQSLGCDRAILGCTELSVYRRTHGLPDTYLDAMECLAEEAILRCGYRVRTVNSEQ